MYRTQCISILLIILAILTLSQCEYADGDSGSQLEAGFLDPPAEAKPRVWWHWMNGNITREGIRADLEWMDRVGIGGFQNFDAAFMTPQIVDKRLVYMTPEWKEAFQFTTRLADSLGLEMAIAGSPGWSESGGPWVKPEQAMKKLVWSETRVEGGKAFSGPLNLPPTATGPFQNLAIEGGFTLDASEEDHTPEYYADIAVLAYRVPDADVLMADLQPRVSSSGGFFDLIMLTDGDLSTTAYLPPVEIGQRAWIQYEFQNPETIHSLTIVGGVNSGRFGGSGNPDNITLESSMDGISFQKITGIPNNRIGQVTVTFDPHTAKYFRFAFLTLPPAPNRFAAIMGGSSGGPQMPKGTDIAELVLHTVPRLNHFEEKAAFTVSTELASLITRPIEKAEGISKDDIVDLSSEMNADGTLDWTPPEGTWNIMRFGYTLTGHKNSPASPEATGLEVDKLSAEHVNSYFTEYLDMYEDATGGLMGEKGLQYIITDSWEAGTQNWTDHMVSEFQSRRAYDMLPWLPVMAGHIVESSESSERFLWDLRRTISDLTTENHYDQLTEILRERGMGRYSESHEDQRAFIGDGMEVKRSADVPMSATWTPLPGQTDVQTRFKADVRESASVSHIYGKKFVAAESMTAIATAWQWSPETLKPTADMEMANGLNRFVIHTSVHQPVNDKIPGLGLGPFGQWFTRHETWAEQAGPWMSYLSRSSYMLQQGKFVADILYFYGEDNNITALFGEDLPDVPEGFNYDFVNADALVNVLEVNAGNIVTESGMSYQLLALDDNCAFMSLPVLRKIRALVNEGAIVLGEKPVESPSLTDDQDEFNAIADELWPHQKGENKLGNGRVYTGLTIKEVLDNVGVGPDFSYSRPESDTKLLYVHRQLGDINFYWVNNRNTRVEDLEATFRVHGYEAEIWHPETGKIEQASFSMGNGVTRVPLHLEASDAVFVVFRKKTKETGREIAIPQEQTLLTLEGPWTVDFQENRMAPAQIILETLGPWNEIADDGAKYFSGTGTYTKIIDASAEWFMEGTEVWLDLGKVKNLAEVIVNDQALGIVWKTPFRVNVSEALEEGENSLEIRVTNLWVNRLIGDQQPEVNEKVTYTTMPFYRADSPLKPSGLLGPVRMIAIH